VDAKISWLFSHLCSRQLKIFIFTGKQAVLIMACENLHMPEDLVLEPGIVMIFAHGVE
jgi:hypothetical protein